jgi:dipeptidyl-peptidase-4
MENPLYAKAEAFLPWNLHHKVYNSTIFPYWTNSALYYFQQISDGLRLVRVDKQTGKKKIICAFKDLLDALSKKLKMEIDPEQLPLDRFTVNETPLGLHFCFQKKKYCYVINKMELSIDEIILGYSYSPDKKWVLFIREHNLFLMDTKSDQTFQMTSDGEKYYDYATSPETNTRTITQRIEGIINSPCVVWSSDSSKIVTYKLNQKNVDHLYLLQNAPPNGQRPKLYSYRMSFSGDEHVPLAELLVIDVKSKVVTSLKTDPLPSPYLTPLEFGNIWWSSNNQDIYFLRELRGSKELKLCIADSVTGDV